MASTLDNRIVSMEFDNRMFEKNIQQSMDSLDKMDKKLSVMDGTKAFTSLTEAAKKVNLTPISTAAYAVTNSFNAMQIAGMTVIQNLTNSFMNFGKRLWNISFGQMKTGGWNRALNIQQAEFMLEGLGLDVSQIKQDAMEAVDGTAYGFDEAARAAATFGASGIKAGAQMKEALLGVAGVAAMTGRDFDNIAHIFSTVAANGKLMGEQLSQFSYAGLNVAAELAKSMHTTEAKIHEMASKGQIDFATFSKAMNDAFGKHAQDANKTFEGSMSNVRAALSRIGAEFAQPISTDFIPALNSLRNMLNVVKADMAPVINMFKDWSKIISTVLKNAIDKIASSKTFFNIFHGLEHILMGLITVLYTMHKTFREVFPQISNFSEIFRRLTIYLMPSEKALEGFANVLKIVFMIMKGVIDVFIVGIKILSVFAKVLYNSLGYIMAFVAGLSDLIDPYVAWIKNNNIIQKGLEILLNIVFEVILYLYNMKNGINEIVQNEKFQSWISGLMGVIGNLKNFFEELSSHIKITDVGIIAMIASLAFLFEFIKQTVLRGLNSVLYVFTSFTGILKQMSATISSLGGTFRAFTNVLNKVAFQFVADLLVEFAIAVGILTISLKALSMLSWEEIIKGAVAIGLLSGILLGATTAFNKLNTVSKDVKGPSLMLPFISLAIALSILGGVVRKLGELDLKQIMIGITALTLLSGLFILVSRLSETSSGIDTAGFFSFSIAMMLLSVSVKSLGNIPMDVLTKGLASIAILSLIAKILATSISITSKFNASAKGLGRDFQKNGTEIMGGLIKFSLSMLILSASLNLMAKAISKDPQAVTDAVVIIGLFSLLFLGIQKAQNYLNVGGVNTDGFLKFAVTIGILVGCLTTLTLLSHFDDTALSHGIWAIYLLSGALIAMAWAQKQLSMVSLDTTGFLKFAGTLSVMTGSLVTLSLISHFDDYALSRAVLVLYSLGAAILAFMIAQNKLGMTSIDSSGFIKFAATLAIMTGSLTTLAMLKPDALSRAVFSLFELTGIIMIMMLASQKLSNIKAKGFLEFGAALAVMSFAMAILVRGDVLTPGNMGKALVTMAALMLFIFLYQKFADQTSAIKATGMLGFATSLLVLSGAIAILTALPTRKMLLSAGAISVLGVAIGFAAKLAKELSIASGTAFTIMAGGLIALAGGLWILNQAGDAGDIFMNAVTLGLLALALAGISKIMKQTNILDMAGFAILAGSIILLAGAFKILENVAWEQIAKIAGIMAGLILVIALFGTLARGALAGLLGMSAVFASLALMLISFGLTIKLVADSVQIFADALHTFADYSYEDIQVIIENMNLFVTGLGTVCDNIVGMSPKFAAAFSVIGLAVAAAVGVIVLAVSNYAVIGMVLFAALLIAYLPTLLDALGQIMDAVGVWFEENGDKVYEFGRQIGSVLVDGILGACEGLAESIYDKMFGRDVQETYDNWKRIGEESGQAYRDNMIKAMDMYKSGEYSSDMLIAGLQAGIENGYMTEEQVMSELAKRGMSSFNKELGIHSPSLEGIKAGEYTIQGVIEGIRNKEYSFSQAMSAMAESGIDAFKSSFSSSDMVDGIMNTFGIGSKTSTEDYRALGMTMVDRQYLYQRAGYDSIDAYVEAQESAVRSSSYKDIIKNILEELGLDLDASKVIDENLPKLDPSGLKDYSSEATKATQVTDKLKDSISSTLDVFSEFSFNLETTGRDVLANFASQLEGVASWSEELKALSAKGLNANFIQQLADQGPQAYDKIHALYTMTEQELDLFNRMYAQKIGLEKNTANDIRKTFVQNGAMTEKAAERYGEKTTEAVANGIEKKSEDVSEKLTATEIKAAEEAAEELERQKIDEDFIAKFADNISSEESKLILSDAFTELGYASMDAFKKSLNYETAMAKIISFRGEIANQISNSLNLFDEVEEKEEKEKITTTQLLNNMEENLKRVGGWSYNLTKMVKMGFSEGLVEYLRQMGPESAEQVEAFAKMSAEEMSIANAYFRDAMSLPTGAADKLVASYSEAGFYTSLGFSEGIDPDAANDVIIALGTNTLSKLEETLGIASPSTKTYQDGVYTVEGFVNGLNDENMLRKLATSVGVVTSLVTDELGNKENDQNGRIAGEKYIDSFSKGMTDRIISMKRTISETASAIFSNFGSLSTLDSVETMDDSYSSLSKTFADKMQSIDLGIDDVTEYKPIIHPVWNMDDIYSGTEYINDVLSKEKINLSGTINTANSANRTGPSQDAVMITNAINNLYNEQRIIRGEINNINSNVASLGNRIDGMYVRLDGNALVGQIVSPMDKAMGKKVVTQKRGRV